jgi:hypothetical protein
MAAVITAAGGVIHLAVIRHHLDYVATTVGFAVIGAAQLLIAAGLLRGSTARLRTAALLVHATIVATWLLSRTVGLVIVPGAEDRVPLGVADTIANALAIGVIAALVAAARGERRSVRVAVARRLARGVTAVVAVATVALTAAALLAPHDHAAHDHPATDEQVPGHDHGPAVGTNDAHTHGHG